tara:strand:+ start:134 stop:361 length:228 start_codon:yes stop_codon:yes gene_type:complete
MRNNATAWKYWNCKPTMLYVIRRDWHEWVEAFSTLAEAQIRFDQFKAEQPDWNLQILAEGEHTGVVFPSDMSLHN